MTSKTRGDGRVKIAVITVAVIGVAFGMLFIGICIYRRRTDALNGNKLIYFTEVTEIDK